MAKKKRRTKEEVLESISNPIIRFFVWMFYYHKVELLLGVIGLLLWFNVSQNLACDYDKKSGLKVHWGPAATININK